MLGSPGKFAVKETELEMDVGPSGELLQEGSDLCTLLGVLRVLLHQGCERKLSGFHRQVEFQEIDGGCLRVRSPGSPLVSKP